MTFFLLNTLKLRGVHANRSTAMGFIKHEAAMWLPFGVYIQQLSKAGEKIGQLYLQSMFRQGGEDL